MQARKRSLEDGELVAGRTEAVTMMKLESKHLSFDYTSAVKSQHRMLRPSLRQAMSIRSGNPHTKKHFRRQSVPLP